MLREKPSDCRQRTWRGFHHIGTAATVDVYVEIGWDQRRAGVILYFSVREGACCA